MYACFRDTMRACPRVCMSAYLFGCFCVCHIYGRIYVEYLHC